MCDSHYNHDCYDASGLLQAGWSSEFEQLIMVLIDIDYGVTYRCGEMIVSCETARNTRLLKV